MYSIEKGKNAKPFLRGIPVYVLNPYTYYKWFLATSRHSIEIKSLDIDHWFRDIVFLLSFLEESSVIEYPLFHEWVDVFRRKSFRRECLLVLEVVRSFLKWQIVSRLLVLTSGIYKSLLLFALRELTSSSLFFYDAWFESVTIGHDCFSEMERGNGFEPSHPRVEALVHSLFYVTPA